MNIPSESIRPEHVLITILGITVTLGIPTLTFLWRIADSVSKLNFKVDLLWKRFIKDNHIDGEQ